MPIRQYNCVITSGFPNVSKVPHLVNCSGDALSLDFHTIYMSEVNQVSITLVCLLVYKSTQSGTQVGHECSEGIEDQISFVNDRIYIL